MVLPFLQLLERDRECVVHEVLPQVAKDLVPEYVGAVLEVRLRNIAIAVDTDVEHVLFGEVFFLVLGLGDADFVVRQEGVLVGTNVGGHFEAKTFLGKVRVMKLVLG